MNGTSHQLIANHALACLDMKKRHILYPRWGGIESGATLSDEFRILWEFEDLGSIKRQLVHRYYIDSNDSKDHGCVTRVWNHTDGSLSFIKDYLNGDISKEYTEDEFLENLGMFLGIICHHISDLCTPVHVGYKMNYLRAGSKSRTHFHNNVERDIARFSNQASILLCKPRKISITRRYFHNIAEDTYKHLFLNLENIYATGSLDEKIEMTSRIISSSIRHTANVWHSILAEAGMLDRKWSMQPLL